MKFENHVVDAGNGVNQNTLTLNGKPLYQLADTKELSVRELAERYVPELDSSIEQAQVNLVKAKAQLAALKARKEDIGLLLKKKKKKK